MAREIVKAHCNDCLGERRHEVISRERKEWSEDIGDEFSVSGGDTYEMLRCCGCEHITMRHLHWFSEDEDNEGRPIMHVDYFPPAISRPSPEWLDDPFFPNDFIRATLKEVYVALHNDLRRIATMGVRAALEHLMISKIEDHGSFAKNLDAFENAGHISKNQREILATLLEAGHATMHRAYNPSQNDLGTLMDITETLLETVLLHGDRAEELKKRIPPRK